MSAMYKCGVCGHPRHAHDVQPMPVLCHNCKAVKATKLRAQHTFKSEEEMKLK